MNYRQALVYINSDDDKIGAAFYSYKKINIAKAIEMSIPFYEKITSNEYTLLVDPVPPMNIENFFIPSISIKNFKNIFLVNLKTNKIEYINDAGYSLQPEDLETDIEKFEFEEKCISKYNLILFRDLDGNISNGYITASDLYNVIIGNKNVYHFLNIIQSNDQNKFTRIPVYIFKMNCFSVYYNGTEIFNNKYQ